MKIKKIIPLLILANAVFVRSAFADIFWPALFFKTNTLYWWVFLLGLIIEYLFIWSFLKKSVKQSIKITLVMNLVSCLLGVILMPLILIVCEILIGTLLHKIFDIVTLNFHTCIATFIISIFMNTGIETLVITKGFKIKMGNKGFWLLCAIHALIIGEIFVSLLIPPAIGYKFV